MDRLAGLVRIAREGNEWRKRDKSESEHRTQDAQTIRPIWRRHGCSPAQYQHTQQKISRSALVSSYVAFSKASIRKLSNLASNH
jgi:hypothetical protein